MVVLNGTWDENKRIDEEVALAKLISRAALSQADRDAIVTQATKMVETLRAETDPGMMEVFLAEYGLSTEEGVALMCLAEALLRVPDADTIDALIEDKIAASDWSEHLGQSSSPLVNASTWGLLLTGKVLQDDSKGLIGQLHRMVKRLGEPVIRTAVAGAMREMGRQFVLGQTIKDAMKRATELESQGYSYSYDMLGEAAMTGGDADRYAAAYGAAIDAIALACDGDDIRKNPGISIKLSALHPRYEVLHADRVMSELVPVVKALARRAARAGMGLNIDAEEADRLNLSLHVIRAVMEDPALAGWDGFGVVVQAYGRRAPDVIDMLYELAQTHDRKIMIRLVKGAYWDTEIKHAQVQGLANFPVFSRKAATDVSYIGCARKLLQMTDRIYPQFATHNAHTVASVLHMGADLPKGAFEFQRLHGMGEALHDQVLKAHGTMCRIYAPVGAHRDLLAYLVRRLLENGANSSFVNQIVDEDIAPSVVASCPFSALEQSVVTIPKGPDLYGEDRENAAGFDLFDVTELARISDARTLAFPMGAAPLLAGDVEGGSSLPVINPATGDTIGTVQEASEADVEVALSKAKAWNVSTAERAQVLNRAADLYEAEFGPLFQLVTAEAGKTLNDAVGELREAVDFLRYYAAQINGVAHPARGVFTCISPWNFPLAIFTGQIAGALAAGNAVLAKPAETTPLVAYYAVALLHKAGVPMTALQLLPGQGATVGAALVCDPRVNGVAFTGSTATAKRIQAAMVENLSPGAPLIAETGGLNAMIVDSTALPEQAVRDIVASAFQSAGQRCSALRCLYVQEDVLDTVQTMLTGAMDELRVMDPSDLRSDLGPVISEQAKAGIESHVARARVEGRVVHEVKAPTKGIFVAPTLIRVNGIEDLETEVFGPVLHLASFKSTEVDAVINAINATGYGLTFGLHSRIDGRVQHVQDRVKAGNIYVNRNQIGAIVGSQPFGGEGLSGTGPKAGGPLYMPRFTVSEAPVETSTWGAPVHSFKTVEPKQKKAIQIMPGPTGELNQWSISARGPVLCLGPGAELADAQARCVTTLGGVACVPDGHVQPADLNAQADLSAVIWWGEKGLGKKYAQSLEGRDGEIVPLIMDKPDQAHVCHERHLCVDTTAAGGNAGLLAAQERA